MSNQPAVPDPNQQPQRDEGLDPASQSLADALRVSFWILKAVMLLLVVAFLGWSRHSGFFTVPPQKEALVLRFGAIQGAPHPPGNHWSWPYPIESRVMVDVRSKSFEIESFFFSRTERQRTMTLDEMPGRLRGGLTPGQDGCMISGDHNLLHALWSIEYRVTDIRRFLENVMDERELVRAVFETAIVRTVAHYKADDVLGDRIAEIREEVKRRTQDKLGAEGLDTGIEVASVNTKMPTPPLQTRDAFLKVNTSSSEAKQMIQEARREADRLLNETAGPAHVALSDAIAKLEVARTTGNEQSEGKIQSQIDDLLTSPETKGEAGAMIDAARSYKTNLIQKVRAEANRFRELKAEYDKNPEITLRRLWANTRQKLLETGKVKLMPPGGAPLIIDVNEDPRWGREEKKAELEAEGQENKTP